MRVTPVETGHKIQLPVEWVVEFGLEQLAVLEKTAEGILIRPCPATTWDAIFAEKLKSPAVNDLRITLDCNVRNIAFLLAFVMKYCYSKLSDKILIPKYEKRQITTPLH